jgi:hypothetical protein
MIEGEGCNGCSESGRKDREAVRWTGNVREEEVASMRALAVIR